MRGAWVGLIVSAGCGQPPQPVTSAPVEHQELDASVDRSPGLELDLDAGAPATDAAPTAELPANFERVVIDDGLPATDALFQFHVRTNAGYVLPSSLLRRGLEDADSVSFAGRWPEAAWALVFRSHPTEAVSGTAYLYRWKKDAWVEVPAARKKQAADYALGVWKRGRIVIMRGALTGGNMQAGVIPRPFVIDETGALGAAPRAPKGFIGRQIASAPSGELFVAGDRPPASGRIRPAIAVWNSLGTKVRVDDLPSESGKAREMWASDLSLEQLCVTSATKALAVGEEHTHGEPHPRAAVWRWDGRDFQLSKPSSNVPIWGIGCSPDGAVWIGAGGELSRQADGVAEAYPVPAGGKLIITGGGDVFVQLESLFRLRR